MAWMLKPYVTYQQLEQYNAELASQIKIQLDRLDKSSELAKKIDELERKLDAINLDPFKNAIINIGNRVIALEKKLESIQVPPPVNFEPLNNAVVNIGNRVIALEKKLDSIQIPPPVDLDPINNAVAALEEKVSAIQIPPPVDLDPINNAVAALEEKVGAIQILPPVDLDPINETIAKLNAEIDSLRQSNADLSARLAKLESEPTITTTTTESEPPEKIFYLPEQTGVFIPNERRKVLAQIKKALDVKELKKFLLDNPAAAPANFQRLLDTHVKDLQKFANKLNLKDLNDEELSKNLTAKYFKLFRNIIFDNLIIVIKDRLKTSDEFYPAFLAKLNEYLSRCGIYTVNAHSGEKVSDEDYENMSPQILKTEDKNLIGTVKEIVRLPYRINYINEATGEPDFFQYNGIMTLYKAVQ